MTDLPQRKKPSRFVQYWPSRFVQYWKIRVGGTFTFNNYHEHQEAVREARTYKSSLSHKIEVVECYEDKETHTIDHYGEVEVI